MLLSAPHIIPIDTPPLSPGVIQIKKDQITALGNKDLLKQSKNEELIELKNTVLLPGFVNAHSHLELTLLNTLPTRNDFVLWIQDIVKNKNKMTEDDLIQSFHLGIQAMIKSGVTTLGDHVSFNSPWQILASSPLRGRLFAEVLGVVPEVSQDIYKILKKIKKSFDPQKSRFHFHLSPHSVHACHATTFKEVMQEQEAPLSCHLAESEAEDHYFKKQGGELIQMIHNIDLAAAHQASSGLDWIHKNHLPLSKILIIHGNYLDETDLQLIKQNHLSIVHCPGSHAYFRHQPFDAKKYLDQYINVALGTDSIASNTELNFIHELKLLKKTQPELSFDQILQMATINGARALRMEKEIGSLQVGKKADIIGFKTLPNQSTEDAILHTSQVDFVMIDGQILSLPERW